MANQAIALCQHMRLYVIPVQQKPNARSIELPFEVRTCMRIRYTQTFGVVLVPRSNALVVIPLG